jgi:hypothetical protein
MYTNPNHRNGGDFAERGLRELTDNETALVGGSGSVTVGAGTKIVQGDKTYTWVATGCNTVYWAVYDSGRGLCYSVSG